MTRPVVFMFSGHGSQFHQMGRAFYDSEAAFRQALDECDEISYSATGRLLTLEIFDQPMAAPFREFRRTHPAVIAVQYAMSKLLTSKGLRPACVWGNSAGELVAAVTAGVLGIEAALRFALEFSEELVGSCGRGGMAAVLAEPALFHAAPELHGNIELAAVNYDRHFVVAGSDAGIVGALDHLKRAKIVHQLLDVEFGFHSAAIEEARDLFLRTFKRHCVLAEGRIPLLSSASTRMTRLLSAEHFWNTMRQPIRFRETYENIPFKDEAVFIDCGPSGTLANFLRYARRTEAAPQAYVTLPRMGDPLCSLAAILSKVEGVVPVQFSDARY